MPVFRVFGLTMASEFEFAYQLVESKAGDPPDLTFTCANAPPIWVDWKSLRPAYVTADRAGDGESKGRLYRLDDCDVLRFSGEADYFLWADRIACQLLQPACAPLVELHLLGTVLTFFLERRGVSMLHASAVAVDDRVVAFLSDSGEGKSTLAASLVHAGYPLLSDDILPVEQIAGRWLGLPGYPVMRMWPDEAEHFLGRHENLDRVHPQVDKRRVIVGPGGFGVFCDQALPLGCIYLPERRDPSERDETVTIEALNPSTALMALLRFSLGPRVLEALGLLRGRLPILAGFVERVPMRRLSYPSGFRYLPRVREAILADCRCLCQEEGVVP